jgi:anaerobic selenocysteine-containing dehydrogenase
MLVDRVHEFPLDLAQEMTEVPVETIIELAELSADTPLYHYIGYGSQAYNNGVQNGHALATLGALTGNNGKLGAGVGNGWHGPVFNLAYVYPTGFGTSLGIPDIAVFFEIAETGKLRGEDFPMKALYMCGSSKIGGSLDTNRMIKNLDTFEFIVCQDIIFCDAASHADILLPASHYFEYEEIYSAGVYTLYNGRAIEPLYESKPDGEIACELAKGLGVGEYFDMTNDEFLHMALDSDSMRALDLTVENIKAKRAVRFMPEGYIPNADGIFPTSTGRLEFYVENPTPRVNYGQTFDAEAERLPRWFPPTEAWHEHEIMKQYPLVFMSERARNRYHTQNFESQWLQEIEPEPIVRMNPDDAQARNIRESDYVYVENTRGHAVARARISSGIRPGMVIYPKGWQMHQFKSGCWGALHNSEFDPVGCNSSYFDSVCEVTLWTGQGDPAAVNPLKEV